MLSLKQRVQYLQYKQSVYPLCAIPPHAAKPLPAALPVDRHTANATPHCLSYKPLTLTWALCFTQPIPPYSESQIIATLTIPARVQFYLPDPQMVRMPWNTSG